MNTNENKQETAEQENTAAEEAAAKDTAEQAAEDTKAPEETAEEKLQKFIGTYENQACIWLTEQVCVTQEDIRNLQLAKAAIAAGIEVLLKEKAFSYEDITGVLLAGGFGSFLNKESAAAIGLIPKELLSVTETVGNAAGEGAILAAVSRKARVHLTEIQKKMQYLELSMHPDFSDMYMNCINFESYSEA